MRQFGAATMAGIAVAFGCGEGPFFPPDAPIPSVVVFAEESVVMQASEDRRDVGVEIRDQFGNVLNSFCVSPTNRPQPDCVGFVPNNPVAAARAARLPDGGLAVAIGRVGVGTSLIDARFAGRTIGTLRVLLR